MLHHAVKAPSVSDNLSVDITDSSIADYLFPLSEHLLGRSRDRVLRKGGGISSSDYIQVSVEEPVSYFSAISYLCIELIISSQRVQCGTCADQLHIGCGHKHIVRVHIDEDLSVRPLCAYAYHALIQRGILRDGVDLRLKGDGSRIGCNLCVCVAEGSPRANQHKYTFHLFNSLQRAKLA